MQTDTSSEIYPEQAQEITDVDSFPRPNFFDFTELKHHFNDYAFSKRQHISEFIKYGCDTELLNRKVNPDNLTLYDYQRLLVYYVIRRFAPQNARILELGMHDSSISSKLSNSFEFWRMPDVSQLVHEYEQGCFPEIVKDPGDNEKLGNAFQYFDVIFSIYDALDPINENLSVKDCFTVNRNLKHILKPGSLSVHCFPIFISQGNVKFNPLSYALFKELFVSNINCTKYEDPLSSLNANDLLKLKTEPLAADSQELRGSNGNSSFSKTYSYNVILMKYPYQLEEIPKTRSKDFLSKRPAYFFHHLIKCGGSSLGVAMENWFDFRNDLYDDASDIAQFNGNLDLFMRYKYNLESLYSDVCIRGHFQHDGIHIHQRYPEIFGRDDIRVFTFVRDPLNVLISLYYFGRKREYDYADITLEKFLKTTRNFLAQIIPCDESNYKERIDRYFFVGIVERIQESFDKLASLTGKRRIEVGKFNTTEKDEQIRNLSPEFIQWVKERNALDYKIYNYCIDRFEHS